MYIQPWNHHHNQNNKNIHHPLKFPHAPFQSLPPPISLLFLWQLLIDFQWLWINSHFLELYINGIIKYVLVFVWFLSLRVSILRFIYFFVCSNSSKITADGDCSHEIKRRLAESEEELKSFLMKVRGDWKSWLKIQHSENKDHGIRSHHFMANRRGNWKQWETLLSWAPKLLQMVTAAMKLKDAYSYRLPWWLRW